MLRSEPLDPRGVTHILPASVYGEIALGVTISMLVVQVVLAPLGTAALRFFAPAREDGSLGDLLAALRPPPGLPAEPLRP